MRLKLLLVSLLMFGGMLYAQDTIKSLVITESRIDEARYNYVEFTNMGDVTIDLHEFEFGVIGPWTDHYLPNTTGFMMIGDYIDKYVPTADPMLGPGESFWISVAYDFAKERHIKDPLQYGPQPDLLEQWNADIVLHMYEAPSGASDSISINYQIMELFNGRDCWYLRHHLPNGDSAVVDQVGGVWDGAAGDNGLGRNQDKAYDVAGFTNATRYSTLVRKFTVKEGNLNFAEGRGLDLVDSEWMPIRHQKNWTGWSQGRKMMWTVGNHGDYNLDETTLTSSTIDIDWTNHVLNVPWGVHNRDSVMMQFDYHPGLAWHYQLATDTVDGPNWEQAHIDTSYISARTGDTLIVWACGNDLDEVKFHINLLAPTDDANVIIPRVRPNDEGWYSDDAVPAWEVTDGVPGMDTILNIAFATRADTIMKYMEKAPQAEWEFVWVDGIERPDVKNGDILKVTSKNGAAKEYYLDVQPYNPNHNANLSSITWPDIPSYYKNVYGYIGDTIPNFTPQLFSYKAIVPSDVEGIPALVAKAEDLNTNIEVNRAVNLFGSVADQTVTFTSTAEDDTTILVYKVQLVKEKNAEDIQPWVGEPFVSQFVWQDQWNNGMLEICNPGTEPLDLSDYMVAFQYTNDPVTMITWNSGVDDWYDRYVKYIPGYKWVSQADWAASPGTCEQDLNVDPIVQAGDVFVLGSVRGTGQSGYPWWASEQMDIDFRHNPWGENMRNAADDGYAATWGSQWISASWFMWKILNDSIKLGLKPASDPEDFELIETWASVEGNWVIGGRDGNADNQTVSWVRKPEYYKGKTGLGESWGNTVVNTGAKLPDGTSEWLTFDRNYGILQGYSWPFDILYITTDIGVHFMNEVTEYKSTISSGAYVVSQGYSLKEEILGLVTGVKVSEFLANIYKKDEGQTLSVISSGVALADDATITHGDSLVVVSANGDNTSKYFLEVTDEGLRNDAVLTSTAYTIEYSGTTGTISGFDYGTLLKTIKSGVTVPGGASMDIVDQNGAYVPLKKLTYDTTYVETQVSDKIFFVVKAENGATIITYQLKPNSTTSDAFVISEIYEIDQDAKIIKLVPEGTAVAAFYANLTPAAGATMQVKDKAGFDRMVGDLYMDDKLTVTAADGVTTAVYYIVYLDEEVIYLSYVLSDVYVIDQVALTIKGDPETDINVSTLVSAFTANLKPADRAVVTVMSSDMTAKTAADKMEVGDMVEVLAGNGIGVTYYDVLVDPTSARDLVESGISVYPNPSNGIINVSGLDNGNRIQVYNALGARVLNKLVVNTTEVISLEGQQKGFYFMTISSKAGIIGHYKLVVE